MDIQTLRSLIFAVVNYHVHSLLILAQAGRVVSGKLLRIANLLLTGSTYSLAQPHTVDTLITRRLYPKSYLKISFTMRELIKVNISCGSGLTGTSKRGFWKRTRRAEGKDARGRKALLGRGYTLSSLKYRSILEAGHKQERSNRPKRVLYYVSSYLIREQKPLMAIQRKY